MAVKTEIFKYVSPFDEYLAVSTEDLDFSWITDFEKIDNEYKMYYSEELSFIRIHSIYVNSENEIEKVREEKILLKM